MSLASASSAIPAATATAVVVGGTEASAPRLGAAAEDALVVLDEAPAGPDTTRQVDAEEVRRKRMARFG